MLVLAAHGVTERVDRPRVLELPEDERDLVLEQRALLLVAETRLTMALRGNPRPSEAISAVVGTCMQGWGRVGAHRELVVRADAANGRHIPVWWVSSL